ncbi:MAG: helix-turn-helix domain-containing protein [Gammaproteobacteria bacterium]|nr:helix-turn-helix domain-containing protein [Gammaproteobacteria bacterium]
MTTLPIPFVVALLLLLLVGMNYPQMRETPTGRLFAVVLMFYAVSMMLIGLRWSHGMIRLLPVVAVLAVASTALLYLAFRSLGRPGPVIKPARDWIHLIPVTLVVMGVVLNLLQWLDVLVIGGKLFYAVLLFRLAFKAPESLQLVRLSWLKDSTLALWGTAAFLVFSIVLDIVIAVDFARYGGIHAAGIVGTVSLLNLMLLGWAAVRAGRGRVMDDSPGQLAGAESAVENNQSRSTTTDTRTDTSADQSTEASTLMQKLNTLLHDQKLYADTELNLQRLARKAGIPARTISRTINSETGQNMSQWVNGARIEVACNRLMDASVSVGEAMQDAGFLTKSNFNREFKRLKGCSPSEWRENLK